MNSQLKEGYNFHTEVACQKCGKHWMWGLSWDQDKEREFICPDCSKLCGVKDCKNPAIVERKLDVPQLMPLCEYHDEWYAKHLDLEEARETGN